MMYLYGYLGLGVVVAIIVFGLTHWREKDESAVLRGLLDSMNPGLHKLVLRILENLVISAIVGVVAVVGWPILIYFRLHAAILRKRLGLSQAERKFAVERGHLQERLTVAQVEAREMVVDPLGAVPNVPFGHLNSVWQCFLENLGGADELWSFSAIWEAGWGSREFRAGYVRIQGGQTSTYIQTVWRVLPKGSDGCGISKEPEPTTA